MRIESNSFTAIAVAIACFAPAQVPALAQCDTGYCDTAAAGPATHASWRGQWYVLETENFQVCCEKSGASAKELAERAESLRGALISKWLGNATPEMWRPRCQIFLYANKRSYVAAVGPGSEHTAGSSLVNADRQQITRRRIDLVGDQTEFLSAALPHELTHVILRDRFPAAPPPRWADEGMATLADTLAKQGRHHKDLLDALASGTTFRAGNLLAMEDYPRADRFGAFYGECVSLTEFLVDRSTPQQFVEFVARANRDGYDAALETCYGIHGARELDREWRQSLNPVQLASYSGR
jgi:hypothetical protein